MLNSYYASMPDRVWERLRDTKKLKRKKLVDDLREYLLVEYHCNLTMFVEEVLQRSEYEDEDFWDTMAGDPADPRTFVDDMFADSYQEHRQRTVNGGLLGA